MLQLSSGGLFSSGDLQCETWCLHSDMEPLQHLSNDLEMQLKPATYTSTPTTALAPSILNDLDRERERLRGLTNSPNLANFNLNLCKVLCVGAPGAGRAV